MGYLLVQLCRKVISRPESLSPAFLNVVLVAT